MKRLKIGWKENRESITLELWDAQGRQILRSLHPLEINLAGQPAGIYYAAFRNKKGQLTTVKIQKSE